MVLKYTVHGHNLNFYVGWASVFVPTYLPNAIKYCGEVVEIKAQIR